MSSAPAAQQLYPLEAGPKGAGLPSPSEPSGSTSSEDPATPTKEPLNAEIDLARRVVPLIECSEDVCSICLDQYEAADPGVPTSCGHHYHLQCIMQWAQRSRECPMCFKTLQLEDEAMNELLPFGEYVSPQQQAAAMASLETWELERLLIRLAAASERHTRHRDRHSTGRQRSGARAQASAPQPIAGAQAAGASGRRSLQGEGSSRGGGGAEGAAPAAFPSSWSPRGGEAASSSGGGLGAGPSSPDLASPSGRSGVGLLKSRLSLLKMRTTKELRSLFSTSGGGNGAGGGSSRDAAA